MKLLFETEAVLPVEKLVPGGLGLTRLAGEVVLLAGALPGETLRVGVGGPVRGVRRGQILEVLDPSPLRVKPDCPAAGRCGGCDFLQAAPAAALGLKSRAALGDLADGLGLEIELVESPRREFYRTRAVAYLGQTVEGRWAAGFYDARRMRCWGEGSEGRPPAEVSLATVRCIAARQCPEAQEP